MRVDLFDFELPPERIALRPVSPRDSARMLVVRPDPIEDCVVTDLAGQLRPGDVLVFNDARVIPAQLDDRGGEAKDGPALPKRKARVQGRALNRQPTRSPDKDRTKFRTGIGAKIDD